MSSSTDPCRVLLITTTFPPDGAVGNLRTLRLLKHLSETGAVQQVLTMAPETYRPGTVIDEERLTQVPAGVRVLHARAFRPIDRIEAMLKGGRPGQKGVSREDMPTAGQIAGAARRNGIKAGVRALLMLPDPEVSWILPAIRMGLRGAKSGRPNVIYSSGPPFSAHMVAAALAAFLRRPWVADFRDPWARAPWRDDRFTFEKRAWAILEKWIIKRADQVLFATPANREDFAAAYGPACAGRFHVVPNGCDVTEFEQLVPANGGERFVLLHAGSLYGARDPSPLFRAVSRAVSNGAVDPSRFRIRLIGRVGVPGVDLVRLVRELGIEEIVQFVPHLPRRQVLQEMVDASALLVVQPITKLSIPGKLYEYLAAGRPILALAEPDGDTAALVRRTPAGVVVRPDDPDRLLRAITDLVAAGHRRVESDRTLFDGAHHAREIGRILRTVISATASTDRASRDVVSVPARGDDA
jgi:glycosyltransferase involved in cell wall biosynthesis